MNLQDSLLLLYAYMVNNNVCNSSVSGGFNDRNKDSDNNDQTTGP
jgi:hypothetical protein